MTKPLYTIQPGSAWRVFDLAELWSFRGLLSTLINRNLRIRYKHSLIGFGWVLLQPALTMLTYTVFFGLMIRIETHDVPYALFAYSGILLWSYVAKSIQEGSACIAHHNMLIKKVYFPRLLIPLAITLGNLLDFLVGALLLFVLLWYYHVPASWHMLAAFGFTGMAVVCCSAVTVWLSTLDVRYRDIRQAVPLFLQLWMFSSPIIYPASLVPERFRHLYELNPMVSIIEGFRWSLLGKTPAPTLESVAVALLVIALVFFSGLLYLGKVQREMADIL